MTIDGVPLVGLTAPALVSVFVLAILLGRLIPLRFYREKVAEALRWKEAYEAEHEARSISDAQTSELLEGVKTNHALIAAIFANSERIRKSGDPDADPKG